MKATTMKAIKERTSKGLTIAELLIVTGIIAVLVSIAIPVLTDQLEKAREINDVNNLRAFYMEAYAAVLDGSLSEEHPETTLPCGRRAVIQFNPYGMGIKIYGFTFKQTDSSKWSIGPPDIGGYQLTNHTVPWTFCDYIMYEFYRTSDGAYCLGGLGFGSDTYMPPRP